MTTTPGVVEIRLKNEMVELERLRSRLVSFLEEHDLPDDDSLLHDLDLCLEEIVTNVIKYAYADNLPHEILVRLLRTPDALVAEIEDDGTPFNPLEHPRPDTTRDLMLVEPGGLGILLVREYMDHLEYHWRRRRNCLIMTRKLN